jgi:hypothetical protein
MPLRETYLYLCIRVFVNWYNAFGMATLRDAQGTLVCPWEKPRANERREPPQRTWLPYTYLDFFSKSNRITIELTQSFILGVPM